MPITPEADHEVVVDCAAVTITRHGPDAAHARLAFLAQGHVKAERVVLVDAEGAKVVLLLLELRHEVEAWVCVGDQQTLLHVS